MDFRSLVKLLHSRGMTTTEAMITAKEINTREGVRVRKTHAKDWDALLAPLANDIRIKASTMSRWSKDPIRGPVYSAYLDMLRKTRDRIKAARALNLEGKTIMEVAKERNLSGEGLRWVDWVPRKVHAAFILAFEQMHVHPDLPRKGKRMIPFLTTVERSASETRWDNLIIYLTTELAGRAPKQLRPGQAPVIGQAPLIAALEEALDIAYAREITDVAPVDWTHLLPIPSREALARWEKESVNGLRETN